jgi:hypothetical protein
LLLDEGGNRVRQGVARFGSSAIAALGWGGFRRIGCRSEFGLGRGFLASLGWRLDCLSALLVSPKLAVEGLRRQLDPPALGLGDRPLGELQDVVQG